MAATDTSFASAAIWSSYLGDGIDKIFTAFIAYGITIATDTPYHGQTFAAICIGFLLWMVLQDPILRYVNSMQKYEEKWKDMVKRMLKLFTYFMFFLFSSFAIFLLRQEWIFGNVNVQEIGTIYFAFIVAFVVVTILWKVRARSTLLEEEEKQKQKQEGANTAEHLQYRERSMDL